MGQLPKSESQSWVHKSRRRESNRNYAPELQRFYNSRAWRSTSKKNLALNFTCENCQSQYDRVTQADHTDHIIPITAGGAKLDPRNLQSLCQPCHSSKTARERTGEHEPAVRGRGGLIPKRRAGKTQKYF